MGQAPSATENYEDSEGDEHDNFLCRGAGCLPAPRFFRRRKVIIFENYSVADDGLEGLVLTDVEDEGDDDDSENSTSESLEILRTGGAWLPEYIAELATSVDVDAPPLPDPNLVSVSADVHEGKEETDGKEKSAIPDEVLSKIVAVDCGMAINRGAAKTQALRRVSVVDGYGETLLSALVRVDPPPGGYLSSILLPRERRINAFGDDFDVGVSESEIREEVSNLLRGKTVVGHSVEGDLAVLGLGRRSFSKGERRDFQVRDTAQYAPFMRQNGKHSTLRELVKERLNRDIQLSGQFHCCEEDAIGALDLYKSVWHEWESISPKRKQIQKPPNGPRSNLSFKERRERKKRRQKSRMKELRKLRKIRQKSQCNSHLVKYDWHCLSPIRHIMLSSLDIAFVVPTLFSTRVIQGIKGSFTTLTALNRKMQKTKKKKKREKNKEKKKKKKSRHHLQAWFKKHRPHCDAFFLLSHCLLEVWYIILSCARCASPADSSAAPLHSANGALMAGFVGMKLFRMGKHRNQSYFGILAQYRVVSTLIRMAGCCGLCDDLMVPAAQERTHFAERMRLAIAGQIMHATPATIAFPVQRHMDQIETSINAGLFMNSILPIVQMGGPNFRLTSEAFSQDILLLTGSMVVSAWFVLRYTKKL